MTQVAAFICYYSTMFRFVLVGVLLVCPVVSEAHWPVLRGDVAQHAVETVPDPAKSRAYYGTLTGDPHTYEFTLAATSSMFIQTLLPDLGGQAGLVKPTGLLVEVLPNGRVSEVTRLYPDDAQWEAAFEPFGGDSYLQGPMFNEILPPGRYRFEVSTPDNVTKYVLAVGDEERWTGTNPLVLLGRIYQVKQFFDKPWYTVWQSPFYYVPTLVLIIGGLAWLYYRRR